ncbi:hypothetical protein ABXV24_04055 [Vibrio owensii]|uniref:hypothetical protein n=1 Tax=Vibrio owensii TaxID=696485 RepID=UPI003396B74A
MSIISYLNGQACNDDNEKSMFVSLSRSKSDAVSFGSRVISDGSFFYVYEIQTKSNFIDVNKTLLNAAGYRVYSDEFGKYDSQDIGKFLNIREMQKDREQLLVRTIVMNDYIIKSFKYDAQGQLVETRYNQNYVKEKDADPQPLPPEVMHLLMKPSDIAATDTLSWKKPFFGLERSNFPACYMNDLCSDNSCTNINISPYIQSVLKL